MAISKKQRFEILRRDGFTCRYCGLTVDDGALLHVDHVIPRSKGGTDRPSNLVAACIACNLGKSDTEMDDPTVSTVDGPVYQLGYGDGFRAGAEYQRWTDEWARQRAASRAIHTELLMAEAREDLADAFPEATADEVHQATERLHAPRRVGEVFHQPSWLWES